MQKIAENNLLNRLKEEKKSNLKGGIYHFTQVAFAYNSNHIEGSKLSEQETRYIFETNTLLADGPVKIDDITETINHFKCFDFCIDNAEKPLSTNMIKNLHKLLKSNTSDEKKEWFNVGEYKKIPNTIGGKETVAHENVSDEMIKLLNEYNEKTHKNFEDIVAFHQKFECIHPFQDGNGRVGRLIMFKECLKNDVVPFVISDELKYYYYRGLEMWEEERGYLLDTCLTAQDQYKKKLDYFKITY